MFFQSVLIISLSSTQATCILVWLIFSATSSGAVTDASFEADPATQLVAGFQAVGAQMEFSIK
jgi:hypothetical protein